MINTANIFLIDKGHRYTYNDLLYEINHARLYYPLLKTDCLFEHCKNLLLALVSNNPLVLLDSGLNPQEIDEVDESKVNKSVPLRKSHFSSIEDVIAQLNRAVSGITLFTSGTTGQPKKVVHTISSLIRSVRVSERHKNHIWAFAYNPTHMAGLQVFFQAFENTNTLVNIFNASRADVYAAIEKYRITHISATPTFYRLLLPVEKKYKHVQRVTLGGEKSDQKLYNSMSQIFPNAKINNIYASTEAGALFVTKGECFQIPESLIDKIKIEDNELLLHKSLLGMSDSFDFSDDYYRTGDLVEWTDAEKGWFRFKSRKNELVNVGGYKVNPEEIENIITQIAGVEQVIVYGKTNSILGYILCADVKLEKNMSLSELHIRQYLAGKLQDYKIPRKIQFVESFRVTRSGKIKRL